MILTKQGIRNLDAMYPAKPKETIELPFNCGHYNMRKKSCGNCKFPCQYVCRACGFDWMIGEGIYG